MDQKALSSRKAGVFPVHSTTTPNSVGFMKSRSVQETTWGLGKGSHKQLHGTVKFRQTVIQHLLSVSLSFPVCRVGQHQRTGVKLMLGKTH